METSYFLAQIVGPILTILALGMLFNLDYYAKTFSGFWKKPQLEFISGVTVLTLGLLLVLNHNVWVQSWEVIITILGWAMLIKAAAIIVIPNQINMLAKCFEKNLKNYLLIDSVILLGLGAYLVYQGFFM